jgi:hypothetical protein
MILFMENGGPSQTPRSSPGFKGTEYNKCVLFLVLLFFSDGDPLQSKQQQAYYKPDQLVSKSMMHGQREGSNQVCTFAIVLHLNRRFYYLDMDGSLTAVFELR